jgi:cation transport protein ChaC
MSGAVALTPELCARIARPLADPGPVPGLRYFTDDDYRAAIAEVLAQAPDRRAFWIFAYGSLIWKPAFEPVECRLGIVRGWHRSFCLKTTRWRGTPDRPGLMMALERGGQCRGVVYRLAPERVVDSLDALWRREIGVKPVNHHARWVTAHTQRDSVRALTFTANPAGQSYVGKQTLEETAAMIAEAAGVWGSCAEYLYETITHLETLGIRDRALWRLQALVARNLMSGANRP